MLLTWKWYLKTHLRASNEDSEWKTKVPLIWDYFQVIIQS